MNQHEFVSKNLKSFYIMMAAFVHAGRRDFDELHIDIMPVFLGGGLRPFEEFGLEQIQLERMKVVELPAGRTHLSFRIVK